MLCAYVRRYVMCVSAHAHLVMLTLCSLMCVHTQHRSHLSGSLLSQNLNFCKIKRQFSPVPMLFSDRAFRCINLTYRCFRGNAYRTPMEKTAFASLTLIEYIYIDYILPHKSYTVYILSSDLEKFVTVTRTHRTKLVCRY